MTADNVYNWANALLVTSLVVGVIATFAIVLSGNIKEKELRRELARANADAEIAKADAAKANEHAAIATEKAAEINERAADLEKEAQQAHLETERIKLQISWREVTAAQRHIIIGALKAHTLSMDVVCVGSDPEACEYAEQLTSVLRDAGSNPKFVRLVAMANRQSGLMIGGPVGPDLDLLKNTFRSAGISFSPGRTIPNFELWVGNKPHAQ